MTIGRKMGVGFGLLLASLMTITIVVLLHLKQIDEQFSYVISHDAPVIANAQKLLTLVADRETGQRGFVITGKDEFLEPYRRGRAEFATLIRSEKELVRNIQPQVRRLERIEQLLEQWEEQAAAPEIAMRRKISKANQGDTGLQEVLARGVGKGILDRIRVIQESMEAAFVKDDNIHGVNLLNSILKDMVDQETGERGFLITGKDEFLEPFYNGQESLKRDITALRLLVHNAHDRDATAKDLDELSRLHARWVEDAAEPEIATRRLVDAGEKTKTDIEITLKKSLGKSTSDQMRETTQRMMSRFTDAKNDRLRSLLLDLSRAVVDQETGQRGFLITGEESFLQSYEQGAADWDTSISALIRLNNKAYDIDRISNNIDEIERLANDWLVLAAAPEIAARRLPNEHPETLADMSAMFEIGTGKNILDQVRAIFAEFITEAKGLTAERFASASQASSSATRTTIVLALISLVFGGFMATKITREITKPVRRLANAVDMVSKGDLSQSLEIKGQDEIAELSKSFTQMVGHLKRAEDEKKQGILDLRIANEYTENIIGSMIDMLLVVGQDGTLTTINDASCRLLGYEREDLLGKPLRAMFSEEEEEEEEEGEEENITEFNIPRPTLPFKGGLLRRLIKDGEIKDVAKSIGTQRGGEVPVLMSVAAMRDDNGEINGLVCVLKDVTEQKLAEEKLRESNALLSNQKRALDEHAIVSIADVKGDITFVNDKFCELSGYSRRELMGQNHRLVKSNEHPPEFYRKLWLTIASGKVWSGEIKNRAKNGSHYWVEATIVPFKSKTGTLTQYVAIRTDITERKRAEKELAQTVSDLRDSAIEREVQDWFKTGQAGLADAMRGELNVAALARSVVTFLAKQLQAQIGAFYVPDNEERLKLTGSYAFRTRKNFSNEFGLGEGVVGQAALEKEPILLTNVPDDYIAVCSGLGEKPPRNVLVWPIVGEDGVKAVIELGALNAVDDRCLEFLSEVSENIAIALDVAQSRLLLEGLLAESQIQSETLRNQTGALQAREIELQKTNDALSEKTKSLQESEQSLQRQSQERQTANEELQEKSDYLEQQRASLVRAKQSVEEKAEELALASKYKSEFLANMSHELRTPLNSLLILSKSLADNDEGNLTDRQVEAANVIHGGGHELLGLINDILDLSKVESGKMEANVSAVHLPSLVESLHTQFKPSADERGLDLNFGLSDGVGEMLQTDSQKTEQIIRNLLSNAIKFTESGSVSLHVGRPDAGAGFVRDDLTSDTAIAFSVIDTGVGIPEDKQKAIFESFQQADGSTSRRYGGTGLGLSISREFAKLLGGEILLKSQPGRGSTFTLYLPFETSPTTGGTPEPAPVASAPENAPGSRPHTSDATPTATTAQAFLDDDRHELRPNDKSILIIGDDRRLARVLMDLCRGKGFKCLSARTGGDALAMVPVYRPSAILLETGLPDINGLAVLNELKRNLATRHIPVHIISGLEKGVSALAMGAVGVLDKPVSSDDVLAALDGIEKLLQATVKRLLVIEDDKLTRELISKTVKIKNVEITEASGGEEGYRKLLTGAFDCVILDLGLQDMNGVDLLQRLEDESVPTPPVIVYTGQNLSADERRRLDSFGCSVVPKNSEGSGLLADKASLFLHSVESALPESERRAIQMLHDPAEQLGGRKILIVDDDMRNTFALSRIAEKSGMTVALAENGQLALELLEQEDDVDLILMDIMMPVMDGYETMRQIRRGERSAKIPIIALTAKAMSEDRAKCLEAGANDYLTKPVDADRLLSLLRVWISKP